MKIQSIARVAHKWSFYVELMFYHNIEYYVECDHGKELKQFMLCIYIWWTWKSMKIFNSYDSTHSSVHRKHFHKHRNVSSDLLIHASSIFTTTTTTIVHALRHSKLGIRNGFPPKIGEMFVYWGGRFAQRRRGRMRCRWRGVWRWWWWWWLGNDVVCISRIHKLVVFI